MKVFMMMLLIGCVCAGYGQSQVRRADGGGGELPAPAMCLDHGQRQVIQAELIQQKHRLVEEGRLVRTDTSKRVSLAWPLMQNPDFDDPDYWGISNFVDHNPDVPNQLQDYQNLGRTYDRADGYNHQGTDIFIWPFAWEMMARDQVWIVAAAEGQILQKRDGHFDQNCTWDPQSQLWNAVYILQNDGSVSWYGHMKAGSLTDKQVGDTVLQGEYLGVVGSSGVSNGPHLHFELYDAGNNLIDPFQGPGNTLSTSWWADQIDYYEPAPLRIMTHEMPPAFLGRCPDQYQVNRKDAFKPGESVVYTIYLRDELPDMPLDFTLYAPDGSLVKSWTDTTTSTYAASYWYYTDFIPSDAEQGTWRVEFQFNGKIASHDFTVARKRSATHTQPPVGPIGTHRSY